MKREKGGGVRGEKDECGREWSVYRSGGRLDRQS